MQNESNLKFEQKEKTNPEIEIGNPHDIEGLLLFSILQNKDSYISNSISSRIRTTNLRIVKNSYFLNKSSKRNIGIININLQKSINAYEIEYLNLVNILSKLGGLFSALKVICSFLSRIFVKPSLAFELFDDIFLKKNFGDDDKDDNNDFNDEGKQIINIKKENNTKENDIDFNTNIKNLNQIDNYSEVLNKSEELLDNKIKTSYKVSSYNSININSDSSQSKTSGNKKTKLKERKFLFYYCYKKEKENIIAMTSYFDKTFDYRNYFKRMIDIEKIKTILTHKNENDKEFILKKFSLIELKEMNYSTYNRHHLMENYLKIKEIKENNSV